MEQMEQIAREHGKILAPLKEDLVLADCGLDSSAELAAAQGSVS
jgi:hypothetical protein